MRLAPDVLTALSAATIDGNHVRFTQQLDRKLYMQVNTALDYLGGKWNRKAKAHVFDSDPTDAIDAAIVSGGIDVESQKAMGFFPTPDPVVKEMLRVGNLMMNDTVLEPSAGTGAIALDVLPRLGPSGSLTAIELDPKRFALLDGRLRATPAVGKLTTHNGDFLTQKPAPRFSLILMNPPFAKGQDIQHIRWAFNWLAPGGRLVAIASAGVIFREDKRTTEFREWMGQQPAAWYHSHLPEGSFRESGTNVNTVMLSLYREK